MENFQKIAREIFLAAVEKVKPDRLIRDNVNLNGHFLRVAGKEFPLPPEGRIVVSGAGKATALMARELENILGDRIHKGHIVVKYGHSVPLKIINCTEGGHPVPDANGATGTCEIVQTISGLSENDIHICLVSGGGSALLADTPEGVTLEELMKLNELLLKCGADITETNTVRKHLSAVKGGGLAQIASPATTISLILSDVVNDPLDVIASGPTVPDPSTFQEVREILEKYRMADQVPPSIRQIFEKGENGEIPETPKPSHPVFSRVHNFIIGNNRIALEEAKSVANSYGFNTRTVTSSMEGNCEEAAQLIAEQIQATGQAENTCLLFGGETTVLVKGKGKGGRNQHLALLLAKILHENLPGQNATVLCAGTDGSDGPTNATGAVVDQSTWSKALARSADVEGFLANNDSYSFFKNTENHILTGPTMTNVMDVVVVLIGENSGVTSW
ncbi:MAG: glycerate kinase [Prolixibacteraceae bacterium]|jgi:glycerate-2-kinase|nr:glycerate kinase [Prolixibacteraceae bacterium]